MRRECPYATWRNLKGVSSCDTTALLPIVNSEYSSHSLRTKILKSTRPALITATKPPGRIHPPMKREALHRPTHTAPPYYSLDSLTGARTFPYGWNDSAPPLEQEDSSGGMNAFHLKENRRNSARHTDPSPASKRSYPKRFPQTLLLNRTLGDEKGKLFSDKSRTFAVKSSTLYVHILFCYTHL